MAEHLAWGFHLGCEFAKESCMQYIEARRAARRPISPFCDYIDHSKQTCSLERLSINVCDLNKHSKKLPQKYQNFASIDGVPPSDVDFYGGSYVWSDHCPSLMPMIATCTWRNMVEIRGASFTLVGGQSPQLGYPRRHNTSGLAVTR
ncbi:hypothetical protein NP493_1598g00011 [Ridgeia piscesae]|uniref:Leishmanolysin-like peptidase n=1 Tax=Ridgeia piscesae TaxID=27915 RepID=A0AAD9JY18_RIDPI|nr:hypothetical protein NP493_1598g00011 [Ridgeia piscesae]